MYGPHTMRLSVFIAVIVSVIGLAIPHRTLAAGTITVTSMGDGLLDDLNGNGTCDLREAIAAANTDNPVNECPAGSGPDTILFAADLTAETDAYFVALDADTGTDDGEYGPTVFFITSDVTIQGATGENGFVLWGSFGNNERRLFHIQPGGDLTLAYLTLTRGIARGGNGGRGGSGGGGAAGLGGAIFNEGILMIRYSTFTDNAAIGGHGQANVSEDGSGGGGGMATDGQDGQNGPGGAGGDPNGAPGGPTLSDDGEDGGTGGGGAGGDGGAKVGGDGGDGGFGGGGGGGAYALATGGGQNATGGNGGNGGFGGGGGGAGPARSGAVGTTETPGTHGVAGYGGGNGGPAGAGSRDLGGSGGGGAGLGGAIFNHGGFVTIESSTFSANLAWGGSSYNTDGGNAFDDGGGGDGQGGGIFNRNGTLNISNSTIVSNTVIEGTSSGVFDGATSGGGIFSLGDGDTAVLQLDNTIVANSISGDSIIEDFEIGVIFTGITPDVTVSSRAGGTSSTGGANNLLEYQIGFGGGFGTSDDPALGPLQDNTGPTHTHAPNMGSPVIDAGDCGGTTADQRSVTRPLDGDVDDTIVCDIGALEFNPTLDPVPSLSGNTNLLGEMLRASDMGPDTNTDFAAQRPAIAYNSTDNEYLIVWHGDDDTGVLADNEFEIYGQRIDAATGSELDFDFRISDMGPDGMADYDALNPRVAYNARDNVYLVVWQGSDNNAPLVANEFEIFGQVISGTTGAEIGDDFRISDMGDDAEAMADIRDDYRAQNPDVAWNMTNNQFLVVWQGSDNNAPLVANEFEIFGQIINGTTGAEIGDDFRISDMGDDAEAMADTRDDYRASDPRVAYNATNNEYLVVWSGDDDTPPLTDNENEIFGQRINAATGAPMGENDFRISDMGPNTNINYAASTPSVAYNSLDNEYLIVWQGDDNIPPLINDEREVFGQRLNAATGAPMGDNDFRISDVGLDGITNFIASSPSVAYDRTRHEYLIVWSSDEFKPPLVTDNEFEIFGQRLAAGAGQQIGDNDFRISAMGPDNDADFRASNPDVAANSANEEYLIAWSGNDDTPPLDPDEIEIFSQRFGVPFPQLVASKTASDNTPTVNDELTYTVVIANSGSAAATDAVVSDILPAGLSFVNGSTTLAPAAAGTTGNAPTLANGVSIATGQSITLTYRATVVAAGSSVNTVGIDSSDLLTPVTASAMVIASAPRFMLNVNLAGDGSGSVSSEPSGITCGGDCTEEFAAGTVVTLTASYDGGMTTLNWGGACAAAGGDVCVVALNQIRNVTATFIEGSVTTHNLSVNIVGNGSVTPNAGDFVAGAVVPITATAAAGWTFDGWSGDLNGSANPTTIIMDGDKTVLATFTDDGREATTTTITAHDPNPSTLGGMVLVEFTVTANSGIPTGSVTVSNGADNCEGELTDGAGSCTLTLTTGGQRTLTAIYEGDATFTGSGDAVGHTVSVDIRFLPTIHR